MEQLKKLPTLQIKYFVLLWNIKDICTQMIFKQHSEVIRERLCDVICYGQLFRGRHHTGNSTTFAEELLYQFDKNYPLLIQWCEMVLKKSEVKEYYELCGNINHILPYLRRQAKVASTDDLKAYFKSKTLPSYARSY